MSNEAEKTSGSTETTSAPVVEASEEEKRWRVFQRNALFLYDLLVVRDRPCASHTVQWSHKPIKKFKQQLLFGQEDTEKSTNSVVIAKIKQSHAFGRLQPRADGEMQMHNVPHASIDDFLKMAAPSLIRRARFMQANENLVAAKCDAVNGDAPILLYNTSELSGTQTDTQRKKKATTTLKAHTADGYGLAWHYSQPQFLSGGEDKQVCLWDVSKASETMIPLNTYKDHTEAVHDVGWHQSHFGFFGSVSDDNKIFLYDTRDPIPTYPGESHSCGVNSISFNHHHQQLFLTGGGDRDVRLWDLRNITKPMMLFSHTAAIEQVKWAPFSASVFAAAHGDQITIWDIGRATREPLFHHVGHQDIVTDFDWNPNENWAIASVSFDATVQIWKLSEKFLDL